MAFNANRYTYAYVYHAAIVDKGWSLPVFGPTALFEAHVTSGINGLDFRGAQCLLRAPRSLRCVTRDLLQ